MIHHDDERLISKKRATPAAREIRRTGFRCYCGGPRGEADAAGRLPPAGFTQVTEIISPGRNRATARLRSSGDLTGCPLTAVMTAPPVMPARAAGLGRRGAEHQDETRRERGGGHRRQDTRRHAVVTAGFHA